MESIIQHLGPVSFPVFTGERVYMKPFLMKDGLPFDLARWQPTVDAMLRGVETDQPVYIMIDQAFVKEGVSHRRPGVHIDGYWHPAIQAHGESPGHSSRPERGHGSIPGRHMTGGWGPAAYSEPEAIILASTVGASQAYLGEYDGLVGEGGDCSHLDLSKLDVVQLHPCQVYAGNVAMLHESLPVTRSCMRTLVRLNVPGWTPQ